MCSRAVSQALDAGAELAVFLLKRAYVGRVLVMRLVHGDLFDLGDQPDQSGANLAMPE